MNSKSAILVIIFLATSFIGNSQTFGRLVPPRSTKASKSQKALDYYHQAIDSSKINNYRKAIELFKLAVAEDSNFVDAYDNLGFAYRQLEMLDSADFYYSNAFFKDTTNATHIQNAAVVAELQGKFKKAMLIYMIVKAMEPESPDGYLGYSRMQFLLGKIDDAFENGQLAEKYCRKLNSPLIGDCYYVLCVICYNMKNSALAKKYLALSKEAGVRIDPKLEESVGK